MKLFSIFFYNDLYYCRSVENSSRKLVVIDPSHFFVHRILIFNFFSLRFVPEMRGVPEKNGLRSNP